MAQLKVLLIGPYAPPRGGVQVHVVALHNYLLRNNVSCEVIDLSPNRVTNGKGIYGPQTALGVARLLISLKYDLVHLHVGGNMTPRLATLALFCAAIPSCKAILTFHSGGYPNSEKGRAAKVKSFIGFALRQLDYAIAVNAEIARWFRQIGLDEKHMCVIPPYDLPQAPLDTKIPDSLHRFTQQHTPLLISVGGLEPEYDVPIQIDALRRVRESLPGAGLLVIGGGSLESDLKRLVANEPNKDHILLSGDLDRELTLRLIAESDVMLRTTHYDGDSIAVREALHFGVPVVASDRSPRPAGVHVIPAEDVEKLSMAIEQCVSAKENAGSTSASNKENFEKVLNLYQDALRGEILT